MNQKLAKAKALFEGRRSGNVKVSQCENFFLLHRPVLVTQLQTRTKQRRSRATMRKHGLVKEVASPCVFETSLGAKCWHQCTVMQRNKRQIGRTNEMETKQDRLTSKQHVFLRCKYGTSVNLHWRHVALETSMATTAQGNLVISLCQYVSWHPVADATDSLSLPPTALCWLILEHLPDTQADTRPHPGESHCPN